MALLLWPRLIILARYLWPRFPKLQLWPRFFFCTLTMLTLARFIILHAHSGPAALNCNSGPAATIANSDSDSFLLPLRIFILVIANLYLIIAP